METRVYLVFHFNRLAAIERSSELTPELFLYKWLKNKCILHLFNEFQVGIWDKDSCSRGGIEILEFESSPVLVSGEKCISFSLKSVSNKGVFI